MRFGGALPAQAERVARDRPTWQVVHPMQISKSLAISEAVGHGSSNRPDSRGHHVN